MFVIIDAASGREVHRGYTTRLHNQVRMPEGSSDKLFLVRAAFLMHFDDAPVFGPETSFFMPPTLADLARRGRSES
jgi:hypothetical protein